MPETEAPSFKRGTLQAKALGAALLLRSGLSPALLSARRRSPIVLRYHRVYPDSAPEPFYELGIRRSLFEAQLEFLERHCRVVPLADVFDHLLDGRPLPDRAVSLTFDDGYRDNFTEAFPALRARGLPAAVFVSVENVERGEPFWWDRLAQSLAAAPAGPHELDLGRGPEVVELSDLGSRRSVFDRVREDLKLRPSAEASERLRALRSGLANGSGFREPAAERPLAWEEVEAMAEGGFEIGSHTLDHPILSRLPAAEAERQIAESRARLERRLGRPVRFFSYPNGKREDVTRDVIAAVRRAGYRGAVSTVEGRATRRSDPFFVERMAPTLGASADPSGRFSEALFTAELSGVFPALFARRWRGRGVH